MAIFRQLGRNGLGGHIPDSLSCLRNLTVLFVSFPHFLEIQFTINITRSIFSNKLEGEIPDIFGSMTNLKALYDFYFQKKVVGVRQTEKVHQVVEKE